jgi:hypothetical protein
MPMPGHGCFSGEPDFCAGVVGLLGSVGLAGVVEVELGVVAVDVEPLDVPSPVPEDEPEPDGVVPVVGVAAAPAIPAAAPPVASAPATIVAPSIFEIFIAVNLRGGDGWMMRSIVRGGAKRAGRRL